MPDKLGDSMLQSSVCVPGMLLSGKRDLLGGLLRQSKTCGCVTGGDALST